jgi:hypothetical protein
MAEMFRRVVRERLRLVGRVVGDILVRWPGRVPWSCHDKRELTEAEERDRLPVASRVIQVNYVTKQADASGRDEALREN